MSMASIGPLPTGSASSAGAGEEAKGFAQAEFDALQDNTLTQGPADVGGTLGLDIQSADIGKSCRLSLSHVIQHADHRPQAISLLCSSGRLQGISRYLSTREVLIHGWANPDSLVRVFCSSLLTISRCPPRSALPAVRISGLAAVLRLLL